MKDDHPAGPEPIEAFDDAPTASAATVIDADGQANLPTLAALGIVAFVAQTMLHEAGGHGGVCVASGGSVTLLAPFWMRCSEISTAMVAAGPIANLLAGGAAWLALRTGAPHAGAMRYFLWLTLAFNGLVAAGYLLVGAATGFGDWAVLFQGVEPAWQWRVSAGIVALAAYFGLRIVVARELIRLTGIAKPSAATLGRLVLVPTGAAAVVAVAAQAYGQGGDPLGIALALGCTFFLGLTLLGIEGSETGGASTIAASRLRIARSVPWLALAAIVATVFIAVVGPGV